MFLLEGTVVYSASDLTAARPASGRSCAGSTPSSAASMPSSRPKTTCCERTARWATCTSSRRSSSCGQADGVVEIERPGDRPGRGGRRADPRRAALGGGRRVPGHLLRRRASWASPTSSCATATDGRRLRGPRHQARPQGQDHRAAAARGLRRAAAAARHRRPARPCTCCSATAQPSAHRLRDILPVYRKRRARLQQLIDERVADRRPRAVGRSALHGVRALRRLRAERSKRTRDVLLVAGHAADAARAPAGPRASRPSTSSRQPTGPVDGIASARSPRSRRRRACSSTAADGPGRSRWHDRRSSAARGAAGARRRRHLLRLRGRPALPRSGGTRGASTTCSAWSSTTRRSRAFWAHDFAAGAAGADRLPRLRGRAPRASIPRMHIYHYAVYERTHLLALAARHGVGEDDGRRPAARQRARRPLPDRAAGRCASASRSYSIKKLEPLYMGDDRASGVTNAADSITEYVRCARPARRGRRGGGAARCSTTSPTTTATTASRTLRLRDWLLARAAERVGIRIGATPRATAGSTVELPSASPTA